MCAAQQTTRFPTIHWWTVTQTEKQCTNRSATHCLNSAFPVTPETSNTHHC